MTSIMALTSYFPYWSEVDEMPMATTTRRGHTVSCESPVKFDANEMEEMTAVPS